jgi:hypothetical protein
LWTLPGKVRLGKRSALLLMTSFADPTPGEVHVGRHHSRQGWLGLYHLALLLLAEGGAVIMSITASLTTTEVNSASHSEENRYVIKIPSLTTTD